MYSKQHLRTPTQLAHHHEVGELIRQRAPVRDIQQQGAHLLVVFMAATGEKKGFLYSRQLSYFDCATEENASAALKKLSQRRCQFG